MLQVKCNAIKHKTREAVFEYSYKDPQLVGHLLGNLQTTFD